MPNYFQPPATVKSVSLPTAREKAILSAWEAANQACGCIVTALPSFGATEISARKDLSQAEACLVKALTAIGHLRRGELV